MTRLLDRPDVSMIFGHTDVFARTRVNAKGCFVWSGAVNSNGYPQIRLEGRTTYVHRLVCERVHGPLGRQYVLHSCDDPACINPNHLRPGTQAENMADARARGRVARGSALGRSALDAERVRAIRARRARGESPVTIGASYGVSRQTVADIVSGRTWSHA